MANVFQDKLHLARDYRYRNRKHNCEVFWPFGFPPCLAERKIGVIKP